jgi:hypothetical protein
MYPPHTVEFKQGAFAFREGLKISDCPYKNIGRKRDFWCQGYGRASTIEFDKELLVKCASLSRVKS